MELYSSSASQAALPQERPIHYSLVRLIPGIVFWGLMAAMFAAGGVLSMRDKGMNVLYFIIPMLAFVFFNLWRFLKPLARLGQPRLTISRQGITGDAMELLPWKNIANCTYFVHTINGIPMKRSFIINTNLEIPKTLSERQKKLMRMKGDGHFCVTIDAFGLGIGNDAFVALCESYQSAAQESV